VYIETLSDLLELPTMKTTSPYIPHLGRRGMTSQHVSSSHTEVAINPTVQFLSEARLELETWTCALDGTVKCSTTKRSLLPSAELSASPDC